MRLGFVLAAAFGLCAVTVSAYAADVPTYQQIKQIISERCTTCHSEEIRTHGIYDAPAGIKYDTAEEIRVYAKGIMRVATQTKTMPPPETTEMTDAERDMIAAWYAAGAKVP